jgi:hypothetical protein
MSNITTVFLQDVVVDSISRRVDFGGYDIVHTAVPFVTTDTIEGAIDDRIMNSQLVSQLQLRIDQLQAIVAQLIYSKTSPTGSMNIGQAMDRYTSKRDADLVLAGRTALLPEPE